MMVLAVLAAIFLPVAAICYGSSKWLKVKKLTVNFEENSSFPKELDGLRILHISDIHGRSAFRMNVDIWKTIDKLDFDLAVITGDLIVWAFKQFSPHSDGIRRLSERVPVFFADGNHDNKKNNYATIMKTLARLGVKAPYDEPAVLFNGKLIISSFRDLSYLKENGEVEAAAAKSHSNENSAFWLALFHQPQFIEYLKEKPDLSLCGHTHGGQLKLPFLPSLYAPKQGFFPKYGDGFYDFNGKKMYVSRGIGATYFPLRFWNRAEITILTLKKHH